MRCTALILALLFLGMTPPEDIAQTCPVGNLLREWRGQNTGIKGEGYHVLRNQKAWTEFWKNHADEKAPVVDFQHEMVIAAFPTQAVSINWVKVTNLGKPGLSRYWVGLCPTQKKLAYHIAVVGRSDLAVDFWIKDPKLPKPVGQEPTRGGVPIKQSLTNGTTAVWESRITKLSAEETKEASAHLQQLSSEEIGSREEAMREILLLGPRIRPLLKPLTNSEDLELCNRAKQLIEQLPTFEKSGAVTTREQAIYVTRMALSMKHADQFSNDPEMRWQDLQVRYTAGPHWEITLEYL